MDDAQSDAAVPDERLLQHGGVAVAIVVRMDGRAPPEHLVIRARELADRYRTIPEMLAAADRLIDALDELLVAEALITG